LVTEANIGVIGGTGLYRIDGLTDVHDTEVDTPFGAPSSAFTIGKLGGVGVAFLPRHGRNHEFGPTQVPSKANIYAFKKLGVQRVISVSAVGSLREDFAPKHAVVPDQLLDWTVCRARSFFDQGIVAHVAFAEPFCSELRVHLCNAAESVGVTLHRKATYVCIEGPQFSTRAESNLYRQCRADVIGMTAIPEAKLAREAELCYVSLAFVTDYDCWRESEEPVTADMIVQNLGRNIAAAKAIIQRVVPLITLERRCSCGDALRDALLTTMDRMPAESIRRLGVIMEKYNT
jgi:5'-methylthioadenosine phosphorylase